ncbi:hypothetical protein RHECIAT_CH0002463 [Rhizobium etli CIAT 652]|uniref:Uncharacterized protein n=1 Tax=Rhizobium etli (strain CIAT 652) TaxID=491916 RepID=B3PPY7_RHIE6|nr:hypothetical protein RHECIAT_CH0002463 [Rhizobium etli CIAT 652]
MPFAHDRSSILLEVAADRHGRQIHSVQQEIRKLEAQSRGLDSAGLLPVDNTDRSPHVTKLN